MAATFDPSTSQQPVPTAQAQPRVLIVEDSEDIRDLLLQILEGEGYELHFADNGLDGIKVAQSLQPRLILMDMSLPGMDGWQAVTLLRQQPNFDSVPIIAVTAHATRHDKERAIKVGCTDYISKPFDMETLSALIAKHLAL